MITDLKPYPAYKDSGMEWLGEVPEGWAFRRGKQLFREMDRQVQDADEIVTCFRDGMVTLRRNRRTAGFTEAIQESGYQGVRQGDLVIHQMDAFAGAVGVSDSDGKASPVYAVCVPRNDVYACYYQHVVRQMAMTGWIVALARGVRERSTDFRFETFGQQVLPFPSAVEQTAIADFLTHIDLRLQRFITAKERLVELLDEEKRAIVHQAITRGLDPDAPVKPSGIEWLGDVPEHWDVLDLGRVIDLLPGFAFSSGGFSEDPQDIRLLRGVNITPGKIRWEETVRWPVDRQDAFDSYRLEVGDLVLGLDRPIISTGIRVARVTASDTPSLLLQRVARLRVLSRLLPEYVEFLLQGQVFRRYITPIFTGISVPHLSPEQVKAFRIGLPPLSDQAEIVAFISAKTASLDTAIDAALRQIELLGEFRTRLISDVVTGKLDVREAAVNLPEDPDAEDPALDERLEEVAAG